MNFFTRKSDHPKIKAKTILFCLSLLACMNLIFGGKSASAQSSLPPFTCDGYPYQVLSGELKQLDPITLTYVSQGPTTSPNVNGIGFNNLDNYAYGMTGNNGDIYRLGSDGTREFVSTGVNGALWYIADMDTTGNFYSLYRTDRKKIVKTDIAASIASGVTQSTILTFTGAVTPPSNGDFTWIENAGTEYLVLMRNQTVYYYNLSTLTITTAPMSTPGGINVSFGATWSDGSGRMWGFFNSNGNIYELTDIFSANPVLVEVADLTPNGNNDGFACHLAAFPALPPVAQDDEFATDIGTAITENLIADNGNGVDSDPDGATISVLWSDPGTTSPSNGTISGTAANGDFTYTPNPGFYGTDTFEYVLTDGGQTDTATVTITIDADSGDAPAIFGDAPHNIVTNFYIGAGVTADDGAQNSANAESDTDDGVTLPTLSLSNTATIPVTVRQTASTQGYLQAWIDWNGNDSFADSGEQIAVDLQASSNGTSIINVPVTVPADATLDPTFIRFRWSTDSGLNSTDIATDGEIEDYPITILGLPEFDAEKTIAIWDPNAEGLYALPGNDVIYTIETSNTGLGPADTDSIVLIDIMPGEVEFYNGDIDDAGPEIDPVSFTQTADAGLTFTYANDVGYSDSATRPADFSACTYTPAAGYDPNVTYICFNPKGTLVADDPDPTFSVSFRARIR